jgi:hypothetical protein
MNIVFIHIGEDTFRENTWIAVEQAKRFFPGKIHVVFPGKFRDHPEVKRIGVKFQTIEDLINSKEYNQFNSSCFLEGFWKVTTGRLIILEKYCRENYLRDIVHLENDVMIYSNPGNNLLEFRKVASTGVLLTPVGDYYASAAFLYSFESQRILKLNLKIISYLELGYDKLKQVLGNENCNEMTILSHIYKKDIGFINYFPITPQGKGSINSKCFSKQLWDGASVGQFLGGTMNDPPGWKGSHHWLGEDLINNKYTFEWQTKNKIRIPFLIYNNERYRLNNLHIHSKKLEMFV